MYGVGVWSEECTLYVACETSASQDAGMAFERGFSLSGLPSRIPLLCPAACGTCASQVEEPESKHGLLDESPLSNPRRFDHIPPYRNHCLCGGGCRPGRAWSLLSLSLYPSLSLSPPPFTLIPTDTGRRGEGYALHAACGTSASQDAGMGLDREKSSRIFRFLGSLYRVQGSSYMDLVVGQSPLSLVSGYRWKDVG
jgi:hypothetical protein